METPELRESLSLIDLFDMFPDDTAAEQWFVKVRWPDGIRCAYCDGDHVNTKAKHPTMPYFCNDCRKYFSPKTNSVMQSSKLGYKKWALAIYLFTSNIKGVSSIQLGRYIGVRQATAWHMGHRIREMYKAEPCKMSGEIEVDETFVGGLEKNKHSKNRLRIGGGTGGKAAVIGLLERGRNQVITQVVPDTEGTTLRSIVYAYTTGDSLVYTDDAYAYRTMRRDGNSVRHGIGEYVKKTDPKVHIQSIESFWSIFKRAFKGTFHKLSPKHLQRYFDEFSGRHNARPYGAEKKMTRVVRGAIGKRLRYKDLIR